MAFKNRDQTFASLSLIERYESLSQIPQIDEPGKLSHFVLPNELDVTVKTVDRPPTRNHKIIGASYARPINWREKKLVISNDSYDFKTIYKHKSGSDHINVESSLMDQDLKFDKQAYWEEETYQSYRYSALESFDDKTLIGGYVFGWLPFLIPYITYGCICRRVTGSAKWKKKMDCSEVTSMGHLFEIKRICTMTIEDYISPFILKHLLVREMVPTSGLMTYNSLMSSYTQIINDVVRNKLRTKPTELSEFELRVVKHIQHKRPFPSDLDPLDSSILFKIPVFATKISRQIEDMTVWGSFQNISRICEFYPLLADYFILLLKVKWYYDYVFRAELENLNQLLLDTKTCWKCCFEDQTLQLSFPIFGPLVKNSDGNPFKFNFDRLDEEKRGILLFALTQSTNSKLRLALRCQRLVLWKCLRNVPNGEEMMQLIQTLDTCRNLLGQHKNTGLVPSNVAFQISKRMDIKETKAASLLQKLRSEGLLVDVRKGLKSIIDETGIEKSLVPKIIKQLSIPRALCSIIHHFNCEMLIMESLVRINKNFQKTAGYMKFHDLAQIVSDKFPSNGVGKELYLSHLTETQKSCVLASLEVPHLYIMGFPGVGKTETIKAIYTYYEDYMPRRVCAGSYGGRMVGQLKERGIHCARTIHDIIHRKELLDERIQLLEEGKMLSDEDQKMIEEYTNVEVFIWDEFSNVPDLLLAKLISKKIFPNLSRFITVFDPFQTAPIEEGQMFSVLKDVFFGMMKEHEKLLLEGNHAKTQKEFPRFGIGALLTKNHRFKDNVGDLKYNDSILLAGGLRVMANLKYKIIQSQTSQAQKFNISSLFEVWSRLSRNWIKFNAGSKNCVKFAWKEKKSNSLLKEVITIEDILAETEPYHRNLQYVTEEYQKHGEKTRSIVDEYKQTVANIFDSSKNSCFCVEINSIPFDDSKCWVTQPHLHRTLMSWRHEILQLMERKNGKNVPKGSQKYIIPKGYNLLQWRVMHHQRLVENIKCKGGLLGKFLFSNYFFDFKGIVEILNVYQSNNPTAIESLKSTRCENNQLLALTNRECTLVNYLCKELLFSNLLMWASQELLGEFETSLHNLICETYYNDFSGKFFDHTQFDSLHIHEVLFKGQKVVLRENLGSKILYQEEQASMYYAIGRGLLIVQELHPDVVLDTMTPIGIGAIYNGYKGDPNVKKNFLITNEVNNGDVYHFSGWTAYWSKPITNGSVLTFVRFKRNLISHLSKWLCVFIKNTIPTEEQANYEYLQDTLTEYRHYLSNLASDYLEYGEAESCERKISENETINIKMEELSIEGLHIMSKYYKLLNEHRWISINKMAQFRKHLEDNLFNRGHGHRSFREYNGDKEAARQPNKKIRMSELGELIYGLINVTGDCGFNSLNELDFLISVINSICDDSWVPSYMKSTWKESLSNILIPSETKRDFRTSDAQWSGPWPGLNFIYHNTKPTQNVMESVVRIMVLQKNLNDFSIENTTLIPFGHFSGEYSLNNIQDGWCITIDTSQGDQFDRVGLVMPHTSPVETTSTLLSKDKLVDGTQNKKVHIQEVKRKVNVNSKYKFFDLSQIHVAQSRARIQFILWGKLSDFVTIALRGTKVGNKNSQRQTPPIYYYLKALYTIEQEKKRKELEICSK